MRERKQSLCVFRQRDRASACSTCGATPGSARCGTADTRSAGTENTASIVALGKACALALEHMEYEKTFVRAMRDRLEKGILSSVPNCFVTDDPGNRLPNTCNIAFEYIEGEAILLLLNKLGIAASSGSACTSGSLEPSHVKRAMGIPFTAAHGTVRFSLSRYNWMEEIDRVIEAVLPIVAQLRTVALLGRGRAAGGLGKGLRSRLRLDPGTAGVPPVRSAPIPR